MERLRDVLGRLAPKGVAGTANGPNVAEPLPTTSEAPAACPLCHGHGWLRRAVPVGHPDFGKAFPCSCTLRQMERHRQRDLVRYGGLEHMGRFTFQTFSPAGRGRPPDTPSQAQAHLQRALAVAQAYAENPKGWLLLTGPSGCGKTHLAAAIAHRVLQDGSPVFFITVADLLDRFRSSFSPSSAIAYDDLFERVCNTPLLVLDDLGAQSSTPWAQEKLLQLLNHRYNLLLSTVITVGVPMASIEERLRSRLSDPAVATLVEVAPRHHDRICIGLREEILARMTFDSLDLNHEKVAQQERPSIETATTLCETFAESPLNGFLLLIGPYFQIETHLLAAIFNHRKEADQPIAFARVPALLDELRSSYSSGADNAYDELFERVKDAGVLLLDDMGSEYSTEWAQEKIYQFLVYRYDTQLPTVVSTHLSEPELKKKLPVSLASRLLNQDRVTTLYIGTFTKRKLDTGVQSRPFNRKRLS